MPRLITMRPDSSAGSQRFFCASLPYSEKVRIGPKLPDCTTSAERGHMAAICSMAITASISVPPCPPSASGMVRPISPCAPTSWATSKGKRGLCARLSASFCKCASAKRLTDSAKSFCSSVKSKCMDALLLRLGARALYDCRPLGLFAVDVGGVFLRGAGQRFGAVGRNLLMYFGRNDRLPQGRVELGDDRLRRAGRSHNPIMQHGLVAGHARLRD